jgi:hypothetical protein
LHYDPTHVLRSVDLIARSPKASGSENRWPRFFSIGGLREPAPAPRLRPRFRSPLAASTPDGRAILLFSLILPSPQSIWRSQRACALARVSVSRG